ncbi:MAG: NYN domain-containing protein [Clostridiales bacterium]|nr:NYN domain-containing protein [Clostridiales bacterium]
MGIFKKSRKPSCIAFVDFEHWYISLDKFFSVKPNVRAWANELEKSYDVKEIAVFADFSNPSLRAELEELRNVTSFIFDTKNSSEHYKKDFTDFILLDYIYRKSITEKDVDTFIIFTGDGHFKSVVRFIIGECKKNVGIYGITGATNADLKKSASWFKEIPSDTEVYKEYYKMIVDNFNYITVHREYGENSTRDKIIARVGFKNGVTKKAIGKALDQMITEGYVYKSTYTDEKNQKYSVLKPNWELLARDKLWIQP